MAAARRRFLIDADTDTDDAVALLMALRDPSVEVLAIATVAGDVPLDQAVQNALCTVELAGASVPVHAGAPNAHVALDASGQRFVELLEARLRTGGG